MKPTVFHSIKNDEETKIKRSIYIDFSSVFFQKFCMKSGLYTSCIYSSKGYKEYLDYLQQMPDPVPQPQNEELAATVACPAATAT